MAELLYVIGSPTDEDKVKPGLQRAADEHPSTLVKIVPASAHRTPKLVAQYAEDYAKHSGLRAILSGAGMSNGLSGDISARHLPLNMVNIGIPVSDTCWNGLSSLLSTGELPPGFPIVCVGVNGSYAAVNIANTIIAEDARSGLEGYQRIPVIVKKAPSASDEALAGLETALENIGVPFERVDNFQERGLCLHLIDPNDTTDSGIFLVDEQMHDAAGIQLMVFEKKPVKDPYRFMARLHDLTATGTVHVGGYKNAAQAAAQITNNMEALAIVDHGKEETVKKKYKNAEPTIIRAKSKE